MERRNGMTPDSGHRRRETDSREEFALLRDKILLGLGSLIVGGLSLAAVFGNIHNPEIALASLTVGAGLLGAPTILRWDERRR
jgi:hypothetical protein